MPNPNYSTVWADTPIIEHGPNATGGRDLVAGDVHGHFDTLEHALAELAFDPTRDRLFSVGDLIDRGPRSADTLEWLEQERIAGVRGNHEQTMITVLALGGGSTSTSGVGRTWCELGGRWWYDAWTNQSFENEEAKERAVRRRCERWLDALRGIPFLRTIETPGGRVAIVHTLELTREWTVLEATVRACSERGLETERLHGHAYFSQRHLPEEVLWRRPMTECLDRSDPKLPPPLGGVTVALIGHTPDTVPRWTHRNVVCIDTGVDLEACGHLTIAEVQTGTPTLHRFKRVEP